MQLQAALSETSQVLEVRRRRSGLRTRRRRRNIKMNRRRSRNRESKVRQSPKRPEGEKGEG